MKKILINIVTSLVIIGIVLVIIRIGLFKKNDCPGEGNVIVSQAFLDSLEVVANMPPDTVTKDTTIYMDRVIYTILDPEGKIDTSEGDSLMVYQDSIITDNGSSGVSIWVKGSLEKLKLWNQPVVRVSKSVITDKLPVPVPYIKEVPQTGYYGILTLGGGKGGVMVSGSVLYLNDKHRIYGGEIGNFAGNTYAAIKYGIKF